MFAACVRQVAGNAEAFVFVAEFGIRLPGTNAE